MSTKLFVPVLVIAALFALILTSVTHAGVVPILTMDTLFSEVSASEEVEASAVFAEDAVVTNSLNGRTYNGMVEIGELLDEWQRPGRHYEIAAISMNGDTVDVTVDVSDLGVIWGQQRMTADVKDGLIQSLDVNGFRFMLYPVRLSGSGSQ